jgi:hypothetical protein
MDTLLTNLFEISINPRLDHLFVTDRYNLDKDISSHNLVVNLDKSSVLSIYSIHDSRKIQAKPHQIEWVLKKIFFDKITQEDFIFDPDSKNSEITLLNEKIIQTEEYSILRRLVFRVFETQGKFLLAIDPITKLYNRLSVTKLYNNYQIPFSYYLIHNKCLVLVDQHERRIWARGYIKEIKDTDLVKVEVPSLFDGTIEVNATRVIPSLDKHTIRSIVKKKTPSLDFDKQLKTASWTTSKDKLSKIKSLFEKYIKPLFPITIDQTIVTINSKPLTGNSFNHYQILSQDEPQYVIKRLNVEKRNKARLSGLSSFNINNEQVEKRKVVLFATRPTISILENAIKRLNEGIDAGQFHFSLPSKFGIRLDITDRFITNSCDDYNGIIDQYLLSNEEKHRDSLPILSLPLLSELYYPIKAKFAHFGKVSQIISNPISDIYSAWNLSANLFAKLGFVPWGISESNKFPNADIVLGIAFSSLKHEGKLRRNIGYVNVFDKQGVWKFVRSSADYLEFDKRKTLIPQMVKDAITSYLAGGKEPQIIDIHYTKSFSGLERQQTFKAITSCLRNIPEVNFISIDKTHPLRVFDQATSNLNFSRGGVFQLTPKDFLLSVAGELKVDSAASRLLKVQVWREPYQDKPIDMLPVAYRILAMTKLNWRSAVKETTEPVTLKYAEEIAKLTNQFSLTEWATVNNQLSRFPWFI